MRMLFWLLLIYICFRVVQGYLRGREADETAPLPSHGEETHRDPVCGVYVSEQDAVVGRYDEQRLYFCSMACLEKYREQLEHKG
jgi:YHS domain-containing protein